MEFTGERVIPDDIEHRHLYFEHIARYAYGRLFAQGKRILDVGCGTGYGSAYLAAQGALSVEGIDVSVEGIAYARKHFHLGNLTYQVADATRIPFSDDLFDLCVSFEVIEHIENDRAYLKEMKRVLNQNGVLILSTPNKSKSSPDSEQPLNSFHVREYRYEDLYAVLTSEFDYVQILGQHYAEGFRFTKRSDVSKVDAPTEEAVALYVPLELLPYKSDSDESNFFNGNRAQEELGEPDYFLALCSLRRLPEQGIISVGVAGMETVRRELAERNQWIAILQEEKKFRDDRIAELEKTIREREDWIKILQKEKSNCMVRVGDLGDTLQERENWIHILIEEKSDRDRHIATLQEDVDRRDAQILILNNDIQQKENQIDQLKQDNVTSLEKSEGLRADLESLSTIFEERETQLATAQKQLTQIIEQLSERDRQIRDYETRLINRVLNVLRRGKR